MPMMTAKGIRSDNRNVGVRVTPLSPSLPNGAASAEASDRPSELGSPGRNRDWPRSNRPYAVRKGWITASVLGSSRWLLKLRLRASSYAPTRIFVNSEVDSSPVSDGPRHLTRRNPSVAHHPKARLADRILSPRDGIHAGRNRCSRRAPNAPPSSPRRDPVAHPPS